MSSDCDKMNGYMVPDGSESDRERELSEFDATKAGVRGLVEAGVTKVPRIFVLPPELQGKAKVESEFRVPVVDLQGLGCQGRRGDIVDEIRKASATWGLFHVINHGVPPDVVSGMLQGTLSFHEQPKESKVQFYSRDPNKAVSNRTILHPVLRIPQWKDTLTCLFDGSNDPNPEIPLICREAVSKYVEHMFALRETLSSLLSEALGLASDHLERTGCIEALKLAAHYSPPCPEPHLTMGIYKHTDPFYLTILSEIHDGLQALHQDQWTEVTPIQGALVILIGDMLQMISNDLFKSAEHRAVSREAGTRLSVASFFYPGRRNADKKYGVIDELATERNPAVYRETSHSEYLKCFGAIGIAGPKAIAHFKRFNDVE